LIFQVLVVVVQALPRLWLLALSGQQALCAIVQLRHRLFVRFVLGVTLVSVLAVGLVMPGLTKRKGMTSFSHLYRYWKYIYICLI
jgi:hypothetical protein